MTAGQRWALGIALTGVLLVAVPLVADRLASREPLDVPAVAVHVVRPGDTPWAIARHYYPRMDPRRVIERLEQLNPGFDPGRLRPGRVLVLPWGGPRQEDGKEAQIP